MRFFALLSLIAMVLVGCGRQNAKVEINCYQVVGVKHYESLLFGNAFGTQVYLVLENGREVHIGSSRDLRYSSISSILMEDDACVIEEKIG